MLIDLLECNPYLANLLGTCAAFVVSFLGNAGFTFHTDRPLWNCARRYLCVSLFSLVTTSAILTLVELNRLPTYIYVLGAFAAVPPTTFLLAKFWAFTPASPAADYIRIQPQSDS